MSEKKTFNIEMPITGVVYLQVEADCKESALEEFYKQTGEMDDIFKESDHYEWDFIEKVCTGNVLHTWYSEVLVKED